MHSTLAASSLPTGHHIDDAYILTDVIVVPSTNLQVDVSQESFAEGFAISQKVLNGMSFQISPVVPACI